MLNRLNVNGYRVLFIKTDEPICKISYITNVGSVDEPEGEYGSAHYLEHMVFKGTKTKYYKLVNKLISRLGDVNAYTSEHNTVYYLQMLNEDFAEGASILGEMVFDPSLPQEEFEKERTVILEEYQMYEDRPTSYFGSKKQNHAWNEVDVIGTKETIQNMKLDYLKSLQKYYNAANMVVSIVGNLSQDLIVSVLEKILPTRDLIKTKRSIPKMNTDELRFSHPSKQAILTLQTEGISQQEMLDLGDMDDVFFNALGGGMHSVLFDRIREELGYCYSVWASSSNFAHSGENVIGCMLSKENVDKSIDEIKKIIDNVKSNGFSDELLAIAKKCHLFRLSNRFLTGLGRSSLLGHCHSYTDESLDKLLDLNYYRDRVNSLTNKDMIERANVIFGKPMKTVVMNG